MAQIKTVTEATDYPAPPDEAASNEAWWNWLTFHPEPTDAVTEVMKSELRTRCLLIYRMTLNRLEAQRLDLSDEEVPF